MSDVPFCTKPKGGYLAGIALGPGPCGQAAISIPTIAFLATRLKDCRRSGLRGIADFEGVCHFTGIGAKDYPVSGEDFSDAGQHSITPYFTVQDADRLMNFLVGAFGATVVKESRYDDNSVQHARLLIGDSLIMLNECTDEYPANVSQMHIYVEDADKAHQRALRLGATNLMKPNDRAHGDRMAGIKDPCGNIWWIATHHS
ncbi:VOC family protein [Phaeobacter marinintestinus]|uniref:VOC family protein n=1 Tax=Falsiphaeobacter marinintestinus TaxID=1492905 RepID=UPI0011B6E345|nr:VOC family protein [Phaeobacter marinintestinus]